MGPWVEVAPGKGVVVVLLLTQSSQLSGMGLVGLVTSSDPQSAHPYGSPLEPSTPPCPGRGRGHPGKPWLPVGRGTALEVLGGCLKGGAVQ